MGKNTQIPTKTRHQINERDHHRCVRCGMAGTEQHHRVRRRDGGHGLAIIISTCQACHRWIHAHPTAAREDGWIVSAFENHPETVPVRLFTGRTVLLGIDGSVKYLAAHEGA